MVPVLLAGALPATPRGAARAIAETVRGIDVAIAGLPPAAQEELRATVRAARAAAGAARARARVARRGSDAPEAEVRAFLDRCRDSSLTLLRAAYDALHQLTFAAWYGNPRVVAAIGYAGPPDLCA